MTQLLVLFIGLSIINVVLNTIKAIVTVKGGAMSSALINAITFGVYTVVIVYTNCELALWVKVLVTAVTNFIGVYIVKVIEEKMRKDKMWRVEVTVTRSDFFPLLANAEEMGLTYNYIDIEKYYIVNFYCPTQEESNKVKALVNKYNVKYFATETKIL